MSWKPRIVNNAKCYTYYGTLSEVENLPLQLSESVILDLDDQASIEGVVTFISDTYSTGTTLVLGDGLWTGEYGKLIKIQEVA